jgi:hypothetical protein
VTTIIQHELHRASHSQGNIHAPPASVMTGPGQFEAWNPVRAAKEIMVETFDFLTFSAWSCHLKKRRPKHKANDIKISRIYICQYVDKYLKLIEIEYVNETH